MKKIKKFKDDFNPKVDSKRKVKKYKDKKANLKQDLLEKKNKNRYYEDE